MKLDIQYILEDMKREDIVSFLEVSSTTNNSQEVGDLVISVNISPNKAAIIEFKENGMSVHYWTISGIQGVLDKLFNETTQDKIDDFFKYIGSKRIRQVNDTIIDIIIEQISGVFGSKTMANYRMEDVNQKYLLSTDGTKISVGGSTSFFYFDKEKDNSIIEVATLTKSDILKFMECNLFIDKYKAKEFRKIWVLPIITTEDNHKIYGDSNCYFVTVGATEIGDIKYIPPVEVKNFIKKNVSVPFKFFGNKINAVKYITKNADCLAKKITNQSKNSSDNGGDNDIDKLYNNLSPEEELKMHTKAASEHLGYPVRLKLTHRKGNVISYDTERIQKDIVENKTSPIDELNPPLPLSEANRKEFEDDFEAKMKDLHDFFMFGGSAHKPTIDGKVTKEPVSDKEMINELFRNSQQRIYNILFNKNKDENLRYYDSILMDKYHNELFYNSQQSICKILMEKSKLASEVGNKIDEELLKEPNIKLKYLKSDNIDGEPLLYTKLAYSVDLNNMEINTTLVDRNFRRKASHLYFTSSDNRDIWLEENCYENVYDVMSDNDTDLAEEINMPLSRQLLFNNVANVLNGDGWKPNYNSPHYFLAKDKDGVIKVHKHTSVIYNLQYFKSINLALQAKYIMTPHIDDVV